MRKHLWTAALIVIANLTGCATPQPPVVPHPVPLELNTFARKWSSDLPPAFGAVTAVYVREDLIFVYTRDGASIVFDRNTGNFIHAETIAGGKDVLHPPVVLKETIVYPTLTALQIYDRKSGQYNRTSKLPFAVRTDAVGSKNMLFLGADIAGGGRVVALDLSHEYQPVRWELMFPRANVTAAPVLFNDAVYAAGGDGTLTAVAADTREALWADTQFQTDGAVVGNLAGDESGVYVSSADSKLYCLNRTSGKLKWQYFAGSPLRSGPVVTKDLVFQLVPGTGLVALDKLEGVDKSHPPAYNRQPRWVLENAKEFLAEDDKRVFLLRNDNTIIAVSKIDGSVAFTSKRKDFTAFAQNPKDGIVFATTSDGKLMAIQAVTKPGTVGEVVLGAPRMDESLTVATDRP